MGRIIKHEGGEALTMETGTARRLKAFARGETTWAEVEGMTFEEAKAIAQVGCDLAAAGRLEEARILFEGLVEGNPKDSAARAALGTVYQKLGRLEDAHHRVQRARSQRDPRNPVALSAGASCTCGGASGRASRTSPTRWRWIRTERRPRGAARSPW